MKGFAVFLGLVAIFLGEYFILRKRRAKKDDHSKPEIPVTPGL